MLSCPHCDATYQRARFCFRCGKKLITAATQVGAMSRARPSRLGESGRTAETH